jgi:hypothetical protein
MSHVDLNPLLSGRHARRSRAPQLPDFRYLASGVSVGAPGHEKGLAYLTIAAAALACKSLGWAILAMLKGFDASSLLTLAAPVVPFMVIVALWRRSRRHAAAAYLGDLAVELHDRGHDFGDHRAALEALAIEQIFLRQCRVAFFAAMTVALVSGLLLVVTQGGSLLCPQIAASLTVALIALVAAHMMGADQQRMEAVRFIRRALAEPKSIAARLR